MKFYKLFSVILLSTAITACGSSSSSPTTTTNPDPTPTPTPTPDPTTLSRTITLNTQLFGESVPVGYSVDYTFTTNSINSLYYIFAQGSLIQFNGMSNGSSCSHWYKMSDATTDICVLENATTNSDYQFNLTNPNSADGLANLLVVPDITNTKVADGTVNYETISLHGVNHYQYTAPADGTYTLTIDGAGVDLIGYSSYFANKCFTSTDDCLFGTTSGITVTLSLVAGDSFHFILIAPQSTPFTLSLGM
ncbi:MAG: hypothetical protein OEZ38_00295 [Gammaproteobacteria bacterium]|nr:hypothetical protein [Gammaproteobacteria bacterium]